MATKKGRGWHGNSKGHALAGKIGGQTVARKKGSAFFSEIGRRGGLASGGKFTKGSSRAQEAGRKGGKARAKVR